MKILKMSVAASTGSSPETPTTTAPKVAKAGLNVNVNVNLVTANNAIVSNLLAVESACTTPRTPEILNSLIAMTNPLDGYNYNASEKCATGGLLSGSGNDSNSNSSGSPLGSPANSSIPSIQKTRSQLIKASLKSSIESKRKFSGSDSTDGSVCHKRFKKEEASDDDYEDGFSSNRGEGLTPEDEERRRRRRERNKIAATKCRLKKRERTVNLVTESEVLETQNIDLKTQIQALQVQRQQLVNMLTHHSSTCIKHTTNSPTSTFNPIQPPYDSPTNYPSSSTPYEANSPYIRPESANILASSYTCDLKNPSSYSQPMEMLDVGTPYSTVSTPTSDGNYTTVDGYSKNSVLLGDGQQNDYEQIQQFDNQEVNEYQYVGNPQSGPPTQQCHNVNSRGTRQNKFRNTGMDNGCMA